MRALASLVLLFPFLGAGALPAQHELRLLVTTTRVRGDFGPFTVTATNGLIDLGTVTLTSDATARK